MVVLVTTACREMNSRNPSLISQFVSSSAPFYFVNCPQPLNLSLKEAGVLRE
jgi:hypothetical protein